jgi:hypothetical protein
MLNYRKTSTHSSNSKPHRKAVDTSVSNANPLPYEERDHVIGTHGITMGSSMNATSITPVPQSTSANVIHHHSNTAASAAMALSSTEKSYIKGYGRVA